MAQILRISSAYAPPPPEGFVSPMTWGVDAAVCERFEAAGIDPGRIDFARETYTFHAAKSPVAWLADFRTCYGPTMNAFEAAAADGLDGDLQRELEALFVSQNVSGKADETIIPATYLQVRVTV